MPQQQRERAIAVLEVRVRQLGAQRAARSPTVIAHGVAGAAGEAAARERRSSFEQRACPREVGGARQLGVTFVGRLLLRSVGGEPVEDGGHVLRRQVGPVGHPLPLERAEQLVRDRIAAGDHPLRGADELEQPRPLPPDGHALQVGPDLDALAERVTGGAALIENFLRVHRARRARREEDDGGRSQRQRERCPPPTIRERRCWQRRCCLLASSNDRFRVTGSSADGESADLWLKLSSCLRGAAGFARSDVRRILTSPYREQESWQLPIGPAPEPACWAGTVSGQRQRRP